MLPSYQRDWWFGLFPLTPHPTSPFTWRSYKPYIYPHTGWDLANVAADCPHQRPQAQALPVRTPSVAEPPHLAHPVFEEGVVPVIVWPVFYNFGRTIEHLGGWLHAVFRGTPLGAAAKLIVATPQGLAMSRSAAGLRFAPAAPELSKPQHPANLTPICLPALPSPCSYMRSLLQPLVTAPMQTLDEASMPFAAVS